MSERVSVIVPALNEAARLGATLERIRSVLPGATTIVVDGGSSDETPEIARRVGARVVEGVRGRGVQCHAGAAAATTEWLLFLHADTLLPPETGRIFADFAGRPDAQIGTFRVVFAEGGRVLNALTWIANRFDSVFTRFGDQGVLVRRSFYERIGGFPPWPLFEDVALFQAARKHTRIHWLPGRVSTSARRFNERGLLRQRLLNARLMLGYLAGESPIRLAERYRAAQRREPMAGRARRPT